MTGPRVTISVTLPMSHTVKENEKAPTFICVINMNKFDRNYCIANTKPLLIKRPFRFCESIVNF